MKVGRESRVWEIVKRETVRESESDSTISRERKWRVKVVRESIFKSAERKWREKLVRESRKRKYDLKEERKWWEKVESGEVRLGRK